MPIRAPGLLLPVVAAAFRDRRAAPAPGALAYFGIDEVEYDPAGDVARAATARKRIQAFS